MAEERTTILNVQVNNSAALTAMVNLQKQIEATKAAEKALKAEMEDGGTDKQRQELIKLQQQRAAYNKALQTTAREIQNNIREQNELNGSLNQLRAQLSDLTRQYDALDEETRKGEFGQNLKTQINSVTSSLKEGEEGTQRFQRNVGNYKNDFVSAFQATAGAAGGVIAPIQNVGAAMTALSSNPIIAILGLLALLISKVIEHLKSSEANANAAAEAFSGFKVIGDMLTRGLQALGKAIGWVADKFTWLLKKLNIATEEMAMVEEIAKSTAALNEMMRRSERENSKDELRIAELRAKAKDKENATAAERLAAIQEAAALEERISRRNVAIAEERLRIAQLDAERTENDKETNDELARLEGDVYRARRDYFNKTRELLEQENTLRAELAAEEAERLKQIEEALARERELIEEAIDLEIELMAEGEERMMAEEETRHRRRMEELSRQLEEEANLTEGARAALNRQLELEAQLHAQNLANIEQEARVAAEAARLAEIARQRELDEEAMEEQRLRWSNMLAEAELNGQNTLALKLQIAEAELDAMHQYEGEREEEYRARQLEAEQNYQDALNAVAEQAYANKKAQVSATASIFGSLSQLTEAFAEDSKGAAIASKVLGIAQIMINTAVGIAEAVRAGSGLPFPANLPAIATGVATVIANTTAAMTLLKKAKIDGASDGSGSSPVLSAAATGPALQAAQGMGQSVPQIAAEAAAPTYQNEAVANAVQQGVKGVQIVASWTEGEAVGNRIEFIESLADA